MKTNFAAFFLAVSSLVQADSNLRGADRELRVSRNNSFKEKLGQCRGATCGLHGDPHIVTCDGLAYDCMGMGLFTIMKNHMYNIQGNFVDVGAREHRKIKKRLPMGASLTNDVMIEFLASPDPNNKYPVLQFSFGDLDPDDGSYLSEQGCEPWRTFKPTNMPGQERTKEDSIQDCRKRCEGVEGCTRFSYWADGGCHLNNDKQVLRKENPRWSRAVAGSLDTECGMEHELPELAVEAEEDFHGSIGPQCPFMMFVDGHLQDISKFTPKTNGYLYETSGMSVKKSKKTIEIEYTLASGDIATIRLNQGGHGPGELWSCHWNLIVCLPESEEGVFRNGGLGLLGTPNRNTQDDWMTREGVTLEVKNKGKERHREAFNYCVDNWCVPQIDSIMAFSDDKTYEDVKCEDEEFIDFDIHNPDCVLAAYKIIEACEKEPPLLKYACEVDCCYGGCNQMEEITEDLTDVKTLSEDERDIQYSIPDHSECTDQGFLKTGDLVCGEGSTNVVTLLQSSGSMSLPEDATVFFGIEMDVEPHDRVAGKSIRFQVNNFLESTANMYVKHDRSVLTTFMDPVCDSMIEKVSGCDAKSNIIEVACHEYDGVGAFALVALYVESTEITPSDLEVDNCCGAVGDDSTGVALFTFEIQCDCPPDATI